MPPFLLRSNPVVGEGQRVVVRAGPEVAVGLRAGLLILDQLLCVGGQMVGEGFKKPRSPRQNHFSVADPLLRRIERLGPIDLDDMLLLVPLVASLLVFVEVIEPHSAAMPLRKGSG